MDKEATGVNKFALVASAVRASRWRFRRSRTSNLHDMVDPIWIVSATVELLEFLAIG